MSDYEVVTARTIGALDYGMKARVQPSLPNRPFISHSNASSETRRPRPHPALQ